MRKIICLMLSLLIVLFCGCTKTQTQTIDPTYSDFYKGINVEVINDYLAKEGQSSYKIVIPKNAIPVEQQGATELQNYVQQVSGALLPIILDAMYCELERLIAIAGNGGEIIAHSVLDEIILCLIVEEAEFLIEEENLEKDNNWGDWVYDIFDDMDVRTMLYSNWYISEDNCYHFSHWLKNQFYCD